MILWMLLMFPGNYDMISEPPATQVEIPVENTEEQPEEEAAGDAKAGSEAPSDADANGETPDDVSPKDDSVNVEEPDDVSPKDEDVISEEPGDASPKDDDVGSEESGDVSPKDEDVADQICQKIVENSPCLTVADQEIIRKIVREEIREAFKAVFSKKIKQKVTQTVDLPAKISEEDKEDYIAAGIKAEPPKSSDPVPSVKKNNCILYLYTMENCGYCVKAYNDLINKSGHDFALYLGRYPTSYRDGSPVLVYPSYELWKDGKFKQKWSGYTDPNLILDACNQ